MISPGNYSEYAGTMEQVEHSASVDERNCFTSGVAERGTNHFVV